MADTLSKGLFITFEGIDGCGKSTQMLKLSEYFNEKYIPYMILREPGGTAVGEKIRDLLLDKKNDGMDPVCELLLFEAARAQIVSEVIRPSLESGMTILCDRFFDSTYAYQGFARGLGSGTVEMLNMTATAGLKPDITFLLDLDPETALERRGIRGEAEDRMEALGLKFQEDVRAGYLDLASREDRVVLIDASKTPDKIFEEIVRTVDEKVSK